MIQRAETARVPGAPEGSITVAVFVLVVVVADMKSFRVEVVRARVRRVDTRPAPVS
jgi:hypothetical protein